MSRGLFVIILLLIVVAGGAYALANMDISVQPAPVEIAVTADAASK